MKTIFNVPRINTNDDQVQVVKWLVADGDLVEKGQDLVDLGTSKAVVTLPSEHDGYVRILHNKGAVTQVGQPLVWYFSEREEWAKSERPSSQTLGRTSVAASSIASSSGGHGFTRLSKKAEALAQAKGFSLDGLSGRGLLTARHLSGSKRNPGGRVEVSSNGSGFVEGPELDTAMGLSKRDESLTLAKIAEVNSLSRGESGNINSALTVHFDSAPLRKTFRDEKVFGASVAPIIVFEIARLLKDSPSFTSFYYENQIFYYDRVDVGVAFDLGKGLKVVTFREADKMLPGQIHEKMVDSGLRYAQNKLSLDDLVNSTVTITDLSALDVLHFHPLINGHQSIIFGVGADSSQRNHPMTITANFDHRVLTGREVGEFLKELRKRILSHVRISVNGEVLKSDSRAAGTYCASCGIETTRYYKENGKKAFLHAYFDSTGSLKSICHICYQN